MNYQTMLSIIPTLQELVSAKLPLKASYALFAFAKEVNTQKDFFIDEERKLIEKYNATVTPQGQISFGDKVEDRKGFLKDYTELNEMEVSLNTQLPIVIKMEDVNGTDLKVSAADLMALSGIVDFE